MCGNQWLDVKTEQHCLQKEENILNIAIIICLATVQINKKLTQPFRITLKCNKLPVEFIKIQATT